MSRILSLVAPAVLAVFAIGCTPRQNDIEKSIREGMKADQNVEIKTIDLTKQSDGGYTGTATADNGDEYEIIVNKPRGSRVDWRAVPSQPMVERIVRGGMDEKLKSKVKTLNLTKESPGTYYGTAELEDGTKLNVSTKMEGNALTWQAEAGDRPRKTAKGEDEGL